MNLPNADTFWKCDGKIYYWVISMWNYLKQLYLVQVYKSSPSVTIHDWFLGKKCRASREAMSHLSLFPDTNKTHLNSSVSTVLEMFTLLQLREIEGVWWLPKALKVRKCSSFFKHNKQNSSLSNEGETKDSLWNTFLYRISILSLTCKCEFLHVSFC